MDGKQCPQVNYNMKNKLLALDKKHNIYIKIIVKKYIWNILQFLLEQ